MAFNLSSTLKRLSLYVLPMYSTRRIFVKSICCFVYSPVKLLYVVFLAIINKRENIFHANNATNDKKTLLFIDRYIPRFDKDAGSRSVFQYLSCFAMMGFTVKFIGDDFIRHEPYTGILERMGIEILCGPYYYLFWKRWLKKNGCFFDYVFLSRPYIAVKYLDFLRKHTKAKIFFLGHDLHFLREFREYALTNDIEKLKSSEKWKKIEFSIMKKSDVVYYFSTAEISMINEVDHSINCKVVPLNIFPTSSLKICDYSSRKDLIFVGGFSHSPNVDAVVWFVSNIMPIIRETIPGIVLNVVGSNVPDEIKKIEKDGIRILGYLDDNTLDEYYKKCRVCIMPLRYGAGIKGKLLEAMYKQIPVITTSIGAEGLPHIEECVIVEDNPEQFAAKLVNMYDDFGLLKDMTEKSFSYIMENFTMNNAIDILKEDFDISKYEVGREWN